MSGIPDSALRLHTPTRLRILILFLLVTTVAGACSLPGQQSQSAPEFADKNARAYQMHYDSSSDPAQNELQSRRFIGHIHMADIEGIFGDIQASPTDENCNFAIGPVFKDGQTWWATVTPDLVGVNLVSVAPDGTKSFALDLDGDRVVDLLDIRLSDNRRFSFFTEARGLEVFKLWLQDQNPFCSDEALKRLGLPGLGCKGTGGSGGGSGGGGPAADFIDPADSMCSGYNTGLASTFLANAPTQTEMFGIRTLNSQRTVDGTLRIEETTDWIDEGTGELLYTEKLITEYNPSDDSLVVIVEIVFADGTGARSVTVTESDGKSSTRTVAFTVAPDDVGRRGYDEALTDPPSPGAPTEEEDEDAQRDTDASDGTETDGTQGDPGPEGDDSVIAEFCQRRANHQSGVEQAVSHDPSAISVSCGDLVGAPTANCKILEWARPEDWRGILAAPSAESSCDSFGDPDRMCEAGSVEDRIRRFLGDTAEMWSLETPDIVSCPAIVCDPAVATELRTYISAETGNACPVVIGTATLEPSAQNCPPGTYYAPATNRCIAIQIGPGGGGEGDGGPSGCQPPPDGCGDLNWYGEPFCFCFE